MVTSVQFQSSYNVTYVGFTDQEMEDVDAAYGKALEYLRTVRHRLASANVEAGSVSADMALALKHHFNLDVSVPKRRGPIFPEQGSRTDLLRLSENRIRSFKRDDLPQGFGFQFRGNS